MGCCTCFLPQLGFAVWFTDPEDDCWEKSTDFKRIAMIIWSPAYALFVPFAKREEKCNKEDLLPTKQWDINPFTELVVWVELKSCFNECFFALVIHLLLERIPMRPALQEWLVCDFIVSNSLLNPHLQFTSCWLKFWASTVAFVCDVWLIHVHFPLIVSLPLPILYESSLN